VPARYVDDCVVYVQIAAYAGIADMAAMWDAAGQDKHRLRDNCASLGRGDPAALAEISRRRSELDDFFGSTSTSEATSDVMSGGSADRSGSDRP
jgi:hypothetical protein